MVIRNIDAKIWGLEKQQGENDVSTVYMGLVDKKRECSESYILQKNS